VKLAVAVALEQSELALQIAETLLEELALNHLLRERLPIEAAVAVGLLETVDSVAVVMAQM
jgi:hypothetical protein